MSVDTSAALNAAIAAHIADECDGAVVLAYNLIVANANANDFDNDQTGYYHAYTEQQPFHVSLGLAERHRLILHRQAMQEDDD